MRKNKLDSSLPIIENFFDNSAVKSVTEKKFGDILKQHRNEWEIPSNKYTKHLIDYLLKKEMLIKNLFLDDSNETKFIYSWKTKDEYTIISGLKSDSYYSYYSAIFLHQLTFQIPKTVYLNFEHSRAIISTDTEPNLTQEAIDNAFKGSQRKSSSTYIFNDKRIILTNGKYTGKLGVLKRVNGNQCFEYTDLERTLIDISVRPVYAGGVIEVMEAFKIAKEKLNVRRMAEYLDKLNFIYPYHQVIGFYLEKAGYPKIDVDFFKKGMKFNFYLTYDIRNKQFSDKWKIFYPNGI